MSKFKLTQTATEVQDILNNSLQKPTGLNKTKLVGVGVNGQENIEIGDNLTLANGKLSAATGSLPSTITFDENGNRTASKDVKVDGKLKLKSLVSASNPDGDITKELGESLTLYFHTIRLFKANTGIVYFNYYSTNPNKSTSIYDLATAIDLKEITCSGIIDPNEYSAALTITGENHHLLVSCLPKTDISTNNQIIDSYSGYSMYDTVRPVK